MKKKFAPNRKPLTTRLVKPNEEPILQKKKVLKTLKSDFLFNENYKEDIKSLKNLFEQKKKIIPKYFINLYGLLKNKNEVPLIFCAAKKYLAEIVTIEQIKKSRKAVNTIITTNIPARVVGKR